MSREEIGAANKKTSENSMTRHFPIAALLLMLFCPAALAQEGVPAAATETNGPSVAFPPATQPLPNPLLSASGRFSSLNPPNQVVCHNGNVTGRVVSIRLIRVDQFECDDYGSGLGYRGCCSLMNVELGQPSDAEKMAIGKLVTVKGTFKSAREDHGSYLVFFIIAENAHVLRGDPFDEPGAPAQPSTSYMICQPPELDTLASRLGRELCVQSTIVANLNVTGPALEAAARAPVPGPPGDAASGDPTAITCRVDPEHSDAHLIAIACARNSYWAWWVGKQQDPVGYGQLAPP
jgi:hypothetical protein